MKYHEYMDPKKQRAYKSDGSSLVYFFPAMFIFSLKTHRISKEYSNFEISIKQWIKDKPSRRISGNWAKLSKSKTLALFGLILDDIELQKAIR